MKCFPKNACTEMHWGYVSNSTTYNKNLRTFNKWINKVIMSLVWMSSSNDKNCDYNENEQKHRNEQTKACVGQSGP